MAARLKDAFLMAFIAAVLALPLAGIRTVDGMNGLVIDWHLIDVGIAAVLIFFGRFLLGLIYEGYGIYVAPLAFATGIGAAYLPFPSHFLKSVTIIGSFTLVAITIYAYFQRLKWQVHVGKLWSRQGELIQDTQPFIAKKYISLKKHVPYFLILIALILPFTPFASRYSIDVATMVLTYIMLAWGLNITVGYAGLLDLGYVAFYAIGAYCYALLAQYTGIGFWAALPMAGATAAVTGFFLGFPVLRLRGDYFAIVTLGFGEIVRLILINWTTLTGGPNGISGVPRPMFFNLELARQVGEGHRAFHEFFGIEFDPLQRVIFLYYIVLVLALLVGWFSARLRKLPLGRAWEAYREDEIACAALGINRWWIKLAAYSLSALVAGLAGAFFATRQGFISPESFTFTESATILAIVILGGIGSSTGIVLAAIFIIGMPELFREFEQYRMLAFGTGMVLIMIWRPGGMMATREPTIRLTRS